MKLIRMQIGLGLLLMAISSTVVILEAVTGNLSWGTPFWAADFSYGFWLVFTWVKIKRQRATAALQFAWIQPGFDPGILNPAFPMLTSVTTCPVCDEINFVSLIIICLNDKHLWSRERIADWVQTVEKPVILDLTKSQR